MSVHHFECQFQLRPVLPVLLAGIWVMVACAGGLPDGDTGYHARNHFLQDYTLYESYRIPWPDKLYTDTMYNVTSDRTPSDMDFEGMAQSSDVEGCSIMAGVPFNGLGAEVLDYVKVPLDPAVEMPPAPSTKAKDNTSIIIQQTTRTYTTAYGWYSILSLHPDFTPLARYEFSNTQRLHSSGVLQ